MRGALAVLLILGACGGSSVLPQVNAGGMAGGTVEILVPPGDPIALALGEMVTLRVRDADHLGAPRPGAGLRFAIVTDASMGESAGGATLSSSTATTDASGIAEVDLVAGAAAAQFRVEARAADALPATFHVSVGNEGQTTLSITLRHAGARPLADFAAVKLQVYPAPYTCRDLDAGASLPGGFPLVMRDGFDQTVETAALPANQAYAALAWASDGAGHILADGCVDLAPPMVRPASTLHLDVTIADRPTVLAGSYSLSSTIDLSPVAAELLGKKPGWAAAKCPLGPAQLVLDCLLDALDTGDEDDCVVVGAGFTASAIGQQRGAVNAIGCRPGVLPGNGGKSVDQKVMEALTYQTGAPATQLARLELELEDVLDSLSLGSRLKTWPTWAQEQLLTATLEAGDQSFPVDLGLSSRPILFGSATLSGGDTVTIGPHGFTLRLGGLARTAFAARALAGFGLASAVDAMGQAIVTPASFGAESGCAAVGKVACRAAGLDSACLADACPAGTASLDRLLARPFTRLDAHQLDLILSGTAQPVDADRDLKVERLDQGRWTGSILVDDGTPIQVTGSFSAASE